MLRPMLKGACRAGAAALALSAVLAFPAMAQDSNIDEPAGSARPFQPLANDGITLALSYTGEAAGNVSGGLRRDAAYTGQVYVGADFDADRIAGIGGCTLHFAVTNRHGQSLSAIALGNNTSVQEVWGPRTPISRS